MVEGPAGKGMESSGGKERRARDTRSDCTPPAITLRGDQGAKLIVIERIDMRFVMRSVLPRIRLDWFFT